MREKRTFAIIFALLAVMLAVLPFLVSFNEILTKIVESFGLYMWVQEKIVPLEVRMVGVMVSPFPLKFVAYAKGMSVNGTFAEMTWNCLGWQSLLLYLITIAVGLKGNYTFFSKIETLVIGLLGIFLINLLRLTVIVLLLAYARPIYAYVYHDYLSAIVTIIYLFGFWWFAYKYVLEEKLKPEEKI